MGHCGHRGDPRSPRVREQACLLLGFQSKSLAELEDIFTETAEAQELASGIGDAAEARQWLRTKLQAVGEKAGFPGVLGKALGRAGCVLTGVCSSPQVSNLRQNSSSAPCSPWGTQAPFIPMPHQPRGPVSASLHWQGWLSIRWPPLWEQGKTALAGGQPLPPSASAGPRCAWRWSLL